MFDLVFLNWHFTFRLITAEFGLFGCFLFVFFRNVFVFSLLKGGRKLLLFIKLGFISVTCIRKCPLLMNAQAYITGDLIIQLWCRSKNLSGVILQTRGTDFNIRWTKCNSVGFISVGQLSLSWRSGFKIIMQFYEVSLQMLLEGPSSFCLLLLCVLSDVLEFISESWNKYKLCIKPAALWSCIWCFYKHAQFWFPVSIRFVTSVVIYIISQEHLTSIAVAFCWLIFTCMVLSVSTWNPEGTKTEFGFCNHRW